MPLGDRRHDEQQRLFDSNLDETSGSRFSWALREFASIIYIDPLIRDVFMPCAAPPVAGHPSPDDFLLMSLRCATRTLS
jgi:hypothetical protein